mgnify:CR=1 FL=1
MDLTPEERKRIYEEEKSRIEAEKKGAPESGATTGLEAHIAGLLCYLGFWVTGIIFLVLEQQDRSVRFHAVQSIMVFGALGVGLASAIRGRNPMIDGFGLIAFASLTPMMFVMIYGMLVT